MVVLLKITKILNNTTELILINFLKLILLSLLKQFKFD